MVITRKKNIIDIYIYFFFVICNRILQYRAIIEEKNQKHVTIFLTRNCLTPNCFEFHIQ